MITKIPVDGDQPYEVIIGSGLLGELPPLLAGAARVAVIHPPTLRVTAEAVRDDLSADGFDAHVIEVPDGEDAKTLPVAGFCWDVLGQVGFLKPAARGFWFRRRRIGACVVAIAVVVRPIRVGIAMRRCRACRCHVALRIPFECGFGPVLAASGEE